MESKYKADGRKTKCTPLSVSFPLVFNQILPKIHKLGCRFATNAQGKNDVEPDDQMKGDAVNLGVDQKEVAS